MTSRSYNKLVRDNIPEIIASNGDIPVIKNLTISEYKRALLRKLEEEAIEAGQCTSKKQLTEELADIQEVMLALYDAYKIECKEVTTCARQKRKERGGFKSRTFLVKTK